MSVDPESFLCPSFLTDSGLELALLILSRSNLQALAIWAGQFSPKCLVKMGQQEEKRLCSVLFLLSTILSLFHGPLVTWAVAAQTPPGGWRRNSCGNMDMKCRSLPHGDPP